MYYHPSITFISKYLFFYCLIFVITVSAASTIATKPLEEASILSQPISSELNEPLGEIALSLDDAPMPSTAVFNGVEKTRRIVQALQSANCPAVGIFAIGKYAHTPTGLKRLYMYADAGHIIANHSYNHYKLNDITTQEFIDDIKKAHEVLSVIPNFRLLFRFPGLAEGKDKTQRQEVIQALRNMGYREGYITVSNSEYYLSKLFVDAVKDGKTVDYDKLKDLYINILWDCIATNHKLAYKVLQRKVKHILLLHENDLAALFIGDLIAHIRKQGWKIISIEEAYQDPIANFSLTNTHSMGGRISAIGMEKGLGKGLAVFPETAEYSYIPKALKHQQIFTNSVRNP
jgi:peptidoglycan/xylan/chitin deacetylase (PgdA/CDA1 family)